MKVVLHLRWLAYLPNLFVIALFAAVAALTSPSSLADLARFLAFASVVLALSTAQRCVTVTDEGLRIRRSYLLDRFSCPWSKVVAVERRQLGPLVVDQLVLREPVRSYRRRTSEPPEVTSIHEPGAPTEYCRCSVPDQVPLMLMVKRRCEPVPVTRIALL